MPQVVLEAIFVELGASAGTAAFLSNAIVFAASVYVATEQQRRAQNAARDAFNDSLRDRYVMSRGATEPRQLVLGRQRVSGPMFYVGSYGANKEHLVFTLAIAAHEIDGFEAIYFDDERVVLDVDGNVLSVNRRDVFSISTSSATFQLTSTPRTGTLSAVVRYGTTSVVLGTSVSGSSVTVTGATAGQTGTLTISYQPDPSPFAPKPVRDQQATLTVNGSGNGSVTLPGSVVSGSVHALYQVGTGFDAQWVDLAPFTTVSGNLVTITGWTPSSTATITYQTQAPESRARVRTYRGAPGQAADAAMISALPGVWTSAHTATGVAYIVVELDYDPDAFPTGIPNVSALVRGAKVYDPRKDSTAGGSGSHRVNDSTTWEWSENVPLLMRHAATSPLCGRLSGALINDASIAAEANICDIASAYVVNGQTYNRARYTAGLTLKSNARPADALNDLAMAMCGKWGFIDGQLRVRAGSYVTPTATLDETWLIDTQPVHIQPRANRGDVFNVVTGKFADESADYQELDFPRVASASYIAEDGQEMPLDQTFRAMTFVGQVQQVASAMMRDARQGMRMVVQCNMRAYPVEIFDTLYVSIARFGFVNKPFEVYDIKWTIDGGIQLSLKEIDPAAWDLGTSFADTDPAPNTSLRSPFDVEVPTGLTLASGTSWLLKQADGTIVTRMRVSWASLTDEAVISGGSIEVRYGLATQPEDLWESVTVPGADSQVILTGLQDGAFYLVKARARNTLVRGPWSLPYLGRAVGKSAPPVNVSGFVQTIVQSGVRLDWAANDEVDYAYTELRSGTSWATATPIFRGSANTYTWLAPPVATYNVLAKHFDTSGNESVSAASVTYVIDASAAVQWENIAGKPFDSVNIVQTPFFEGGNRRNWTSGSIVTVTGQAWTKALQLSQRDTKEDVTPTPVRPGEQIYGAADFDTSSTTLDCALGFFCLDASGTVIAAVNCAIAVAGVSWARVSGVGTVAAGTVSIIPWIVMGGFSGFGTARCTNLLLQRAVPTKQIQPGAATDVVLDTQDFGGNSSIIPNGGGFVTIRSFTYTPPVDCTIEFTATVAADKVLPDSGNNLEWTMALGAGSDTVIAYCNSDSGSRQTFPGMATLSATAGVALTFKLRGRRLSGNPAMALYASVMRVTAVKR